MSYVSNLIDRVNWAGVSDLAFLTPQVYGTIPYSDFEPRRNTAQTGLDIGKGILENGRSILGGANPSTIVGNVFSVAAQGIFQGIMERAERKETRPARQEAMNQEVSFYFGRNIGTNDPWLTGLGSQIADWVTKGTSFSIDREKGEITLKAAAMRGNQNPQPVTRKLSDFIPGYVPGEKSPEQKAATPEPAPEESYSYAPESFEPVYSVGYGRQTSVMATSGRFNDPVFGNPVISFLGSKFA